MTANRRCATAAGLAWIAALFLIACGSEEPSQSTAASESTASESGQAAAPVTPAPDDAAAQTDAAIKEKYYADLPEDQRPTVDSDENGTFRYSGKTETGEVFNAQLGGDVGIPEGFPKEIPIYPGAVASSAMDTEGGMSMVTVESGDGESIVYQYYTEKLPASGWTVDNEINVGSGRILNATKGELQAVIHIQEREGGSSIGFMVNPKE